MTLIRSIALPQAAGAAPIAPRSAPAQRSFALPLIGVLFLLIVAMMFTLSGSVLWDLGLNYSGLAGAIASKIHPATYLAIATVGVLIITRRNPASFFAALVTRQPGTLVFLIATILAGAVIIIDQRRNIAVMFDTYLLAVLLSLIATELDARQLARVEKLIHILMAANAVLGLIEFVIDYRIFPHRFEGVPFDWDKRSTALLGHPLENAHITGTYLIILLARGGSSMPKALRFPAILLQLAALVPFGGRSALSLAVAMIAIWLVPPMIYILRGGRMSLPVVAAVALMSPILVLGVGWFAIGGFFDVVLTRFSSDGGSAQTRLEMFEIFSYLSLRDIFIGAGSDLIDSIRRTHGLEWGIENPVVRLLLYQGAALTTFMVVGFILFMTEIGRRLRRGAAMPIIFFLVVANSYESIANKTVIFGEFVVLLLVMFDRRSEPATA